MVVFPPYILNDAWTPEGGGFLGRTTFVRVPIVIFVTHLSSLFLFLLSILTDRNSSEVHR